MKKLIHILLTAACITTVASANAQAQWHCYDFDQAADTYYTVGDVVVTPYATITIEPYSINGTPATSEVRHAQLASSMIAGGNVPEMELKLVSVRVVPTLPITEMRTRLAQNISPTGGFAYSHISVNDDIFETPNGFEAMNGIALDDAAVGTADVSATMTPVVGGNWLSGTLEIQATQGVIESFTLGGHTWRIDDMCFIL